MELHRSHTSGSELRAAGNYTTRKGGFPTMQWRWRSCHAAPGWARGKGILNTWLPASTLFQWRCVPAARQEDQLPLYYWLGASGFGNGEWRRMRCTCCQLPGPGANVIDQWGLGNVAMEPMEWTTEPGKIYSKLREGVVAIIKFLPPCKLCL